MRSGLTGTATAPAHGISNNGLAMRMPVMFSNFQPAQMLRRIHEFAMGQMPSAISPWTPGTVLRSKDKKPALVEWRSHIHLLAFQSSDMHTVWI